MRRRPTTRRRLPRSAACARAARPTVPDGPPRLPGLRKVGGEGEPEVFVGDEQTAIAIDPGRWARLAAAVLESEGVRGNVELSLLFVDEDAIADLNEQFMGKAAPTDVLAFPIDAAEVEI